MEIPEFNGSWDPSSVKLQSFLDIWMTLVHNQEDISDIEKLAALRYYVKGRALEWIEGLPFQANQYGNSLQTLIERFGKRSFRGISSVMQLEAELLYLPAPRPPNSPRVEEINKFWRAADSLLHQLATKGIKIDNETTLTILTSLRLKLPVSLFKKLEDWKDPNADWTFPLFRQLMDRCFQSEEQPPPVNPPIQQVPPRHFPNSDAIAQSQERQDGSAKAVPSTSGFLTRNGGSLNQADPNAHQEVGMDQLKDGMPSPSNVQCGLDDRKQHPHEQLAQQEPCQHQSSQHQSPQELSQEQSSQQQSPQQELSQEQSSQQQSPQQEQGMDPLPDQNFASPQGQFGESSGQTGACSSPISQDAIPAPMVKQIRRQRNVSTPDNKTETSDSPPPAASATRRRRVPSQSRSSRTSVERPKSRSSTRIRAVEWQKEHRKRPRKKSTSNNKGSRISHKRQRRGRLRSGTSSHRRSKCHMDPEEEEVRERKNPQRLQDYNERLQEKRLGVCLNHLIFSSFRENSRHSQRKRRGRPACRGIWPFFAS